MIGIVFEHPTWLTPLFSALETRCVPFRKIDLSSFAYDMCEADMLPLYINRLSASSYERHNQQAIALAFSYFRFLTANGATILNGRNAHLEVNKVDQLLAFRQHGLNIPRTWVFNDREQLHRLPADFRFPLLVKPAQGGAGSLIQRFDTREALISGVSSIPTPPDDLMLAQEYIQPVHGYINRVEILDGELLYALRVYPSESFNLCPADACELDAAQASNARFLLHDHLDPSMVQTIVHVFTSLGIDFGSIEFLEGEDGVNYFYDLNLNSNYRTQIPGVEDFDPWGTLADYLGAKLQAVASHAGNTPGGVSL